MDLHTLLKLSLTQVVLCWCGYLTVADCNILIISRLICCVSTLVVSELIYKEVVAYELIEQRTHVGRNAIRNHSPGQSTI